MIKLKSENEHIIYKLIEEQDFGFIDEPVIEDVERKEGIRRIKIPPEILKELIIESIHEDKSIRYLIISPLFAILSLLISVLSIIAMVGLFITEFIILVLPLLFVCIFGIYSYYYFRDEA